MGIRAVQKIRGAEAGAGAMARAGCVPRGDALCPGAARAACPAPGEGKASLFRERGWPLLPKMEERVLRHDSPMCNTSCEDWRAAGAQPSQNLWCYASRSQAHPCWLCKSKMCPTYTPHPFPLPRKAHFSPCLTHSSYLLLLACTAWCAFNKRHPQRVSPQAHRTPLVGAAMVYCKAKLDIKVITKHLPSPHRDLSSSQRQWDYYRDAAPEPKPIVMPWRLSQ